jgi:hypothetical protein
MMGLATILPVSLSLLRQAAAASSGSGVYDRAPWTDIEDFVSLETHDDGTPFVPVPGDGGLCGAIHTEAENMTVTPRDANSYRGATSPAGAGGKAARPPWPRDCIGFLPTS